MSILTIPSPTGDVLRSGKMVCVGRNYAKHAAELNNELPSFPLIFLKPFSTAIWSDNEIIYPDYSKNLHHEVELTILIGKSIKDISEQDALSAVAGYGVGLDLTLRDLQDELKKKGEPWTLAKCFDTCAVLSPFVLPLNGEINLTSRISLKVNGVEKQHAPLSEMIFKPASIISYISSRMTLEPGDVIFTGTPEGVGALQRGDVLSAEIEHLAELNCKVR